MINIAPFTTKIAFYIQKSKMKIETETGRSDNNKYNGIIKLNKDVIYSTGPVFENKLMCNTFLKGMIDKLRNPFKNKIKH